MHHWQIGMAMIHVSLVASFNLLPVLILRAGSNRNAYLVFTARTLLLLLYEVGRRCWRRSGPHAANDSNTVLRERGETQLLTLTNLYALELLEATKCELKQKAGF